jgi:DNA-binding NarL/FixJ family response regulator
LQNQVKKALVYLVDDHPLIRESLTSLINQQGDLAVCGEAESGSRALLEIAALKPAVVILDLSLEGSSGLELIKAAKSTLPDLSILVLSVHDEDLYAERCIRAGADGYVMKRESSTRVVAAVREVLAGRMWVSDKMKAAFAKKFVTGRESRGDSPVNVLSDRELMVFGLLGQGVATRDVAEHLNVSKKTAYAYCTRIKHKLHLANATELRRKAIHWHDRNTR